METGVSIKSVDASLYKGSGDALKMILKSEGLRGIYKVSSETEVGDVTPHPQYHTALFVHFNSFILFGRLSPIFI